MRKDKSEEMFEKALREEAKQLRTDPDYFHTAFYNKPISLQAELILVFSGNHQEFLCWCRENDRNPKSKDVRYISSEKSLRGIDISRYRLVRYGTYYNRHDCDEIEDLLSELIAVGRLTTCQLGK